MIILYIPFVRDEAGDLTDLVCRWKDNHPHPATQPLTIIYHNDDYEQEDISYGTSIYICAHGFDEHKLKVGNNRDPQKASYVDAARLAGRFNQDFIPIAYKLSAVHLYCCGSATKNAYLAQQFKENLLRPVRAVVFYNGMLSIPDQFGNRWSFGQNKPVPVDFTADFSFYDTSEEDVPATRRRSIKDLDLDDWLEEGRINRQHTFFARIKTARAEVLAKKRRQSEENIESSNAVLVLTK